MKRKRRGVQSTHEPGVPIRVIVDKEDPGHDKIVPNDVVKALYRDHSLSYDIDLDMYYCPDGIVPTDIAHYPSAGSRMAKELVKASRLIRGTVVYIKKKKRLDGNS
jgi:hypothetical protein